MRVDVRGLDVVELRGLEGGVVVAGGDECTRRRGALGCMHSERRS